MFRALCPLCKVKTDVEIVFGKPSKATDLSRRSAVIWCQGCNVKFHIEAITEFFPAEAEGFALDEVQAK